MGQVILDKICQQEIDALKTQVTNLQTQINIANQTSQLVADNNAQTLYLKQTLNPTPIPAYIVAAPGTTPSTGTT